MKNTLVCCPILFLACAALAAQPTERLAGLFRCQLHRGAGHARPDNVLGSFLWTWGQGVAPEADARLTKDGVAIACHDDTLKRCAGKGIDPVLATRKIKDLTWVEIRDVPMPAHKGKDWEWERIPTMESVFAAMKGRPDRILYLDEKGASPELMGEMSTRFDVAEQVYYTSSNFRLIPRWKKVCPKGKSMVWLGTWPKVNTPETIAHAEKFLDDTFAAMAKTDFAGIDQIQLHIRTDVRQTDPFCPSSDYLRRAIEMLHAKGITVQAFTWTEGRNKTVLRKIWDLGFDSFATDDTDVLLDFIRDLKNEK